MSRKARYLFRFFVIVIAIILCLTVLPSLIGILMGIMLVFALVDYSSRRYRNHVRSFNSAVRAVCQHEGGIGKVALAFSRSGPLSGECYEYTRRLMMGEDPVDAAVQSRLPLRLGTAIAMQTPSVDDRGQQRQRAETAELAMVDATMMPAYGQFIYLVGAAMVTAVVLAFMAFFITPTITQLFDEFGLSLPFPRLFSITPTFAILVALAVLIMGIVPLLNRGHLFGIRLPRWVPALPQLAERKAEFLRGLADGFDAGWPIGRTLAIGHAVSRREVERRSLERAMRLIQDGNEPIQSIGRVGLLDPQEVSWLVDAPPQRAAELLRSIADQNLRDSKANVRWSMAIVFPMFVLALGAAVFAFALGFFSALFTLINGLS